MDQLIIKSLQGITTTPEEEWLRRWRAEAPENDQRYRQAKRLWELTAVGDPRRSEHTPPDVDLVVQLADGDPPDRLGDTAEIPVPMDRSTSDVPDGHVRSRWQRRAASGALAASLVAAGFGLAWLGIRQATPSPFAESTVVTGAGERTTVNLYDGSSIRVGASSRLTLTEDPDGITARLAGRAFFAVQANPARRFRVIAEHGEATVHGTRFEVRSEEEEFRVMVVDGRVRVSSPTGSEVELVDNEMSLSDGGAPPTKSTVADVYEQLAWMGNALVFQGTPLEQVAREIERYFDITVVLEAPELSGTTVSVTFTDEDLDQVIMVVCEIVGALCLIEDDRIRILTDVPATRVEVS